MHSTCIQIRFAFPFLMFTHRNYKEKRFRKVKRLWILSWCVTKECQHPTSLVLQWRSWKISLLKRGSSSFEISFEKTAFSSLQLTISKFAQIIGMMKRSTHEFPASCSVAMFWSSQFRKVFYASWCGVCKYFVNFVKIQGRPERAQKWCDNHDTELWPPQDSYFLCSRCRSSRSRL